MNEAMGVLTMCLLSRFIINL